MSCFKGCGCNSDDFNKLDYSRPPPSSIGLEGYRSIKKEKKTIKMTENPRSFLV